MVIQNINKMYLKSVPCPVINISLKSVYNFWSYLANKQTNRQTNAGKHNFPLLTTFHAYFKHSLNINYVL